MEEKDKMMELYNQWFKDIQDRLTNSLYYRDNPKHFKGLLEKFTGKSMSDGEVIEYSQNRVESLINLSQDLASCKVFEIDKETQDALSQTQNKIYIRPVPFNFFFISAKLTFRDITFNGFLVGKYKNGIFIKTFADMEKIKKLRDMKKYQGKSLFGFTKIMTIPLKEKKTNKEYIEELEDKTEGILKKPYRDFVKSFVCNFLDFLNHPDVETRVIKWFNNENRIKKGKSPVPDRAKITISGKLYRYIYETFPSMQERASPSYAFWVRGHYMHFWDRDKWNKIYGMEITQLKKLGYQVDGDDGLIKKWVFAYIKGDGKPKEIIRVLKKDKGDEYDG